MQPKNGPCGVLSVIQAVLIAERIDRIGKCDANMPFSSQEIVRAIGSIIRVCAKDREDGSCTMVMWTEKPDVTEETITLDALDKFLADNFDAFTEKGGLVLLVYSAVATRGQEKVRQDISNGAGEPHLVTGSNWFCTSELMSLLMRGNACGNVGAYGLDGKKQIFTVPTKIGMLSMSDYDGKV